MFEHFKKNISLFQCPLCGGNLSISNNSIACEKCRQQYPSEGHIPLFFVEPQEGLKKKDVTPQIRTFYEKTPFPNYENFESIADLIQKAEKGVFARLLNDQIPFNIPVLEVGCGTGQLTNYLASSYRTVFGADLSVNSLSLGDSFKRNNDISRAGFYQMNLFCPIFKPGSFPVVICNGVLHHTSNPYLGFQQIGKLVKKNGYILIGLYNRYGRFFTNVRRIIFNITKNRFKKLDPNLRKNNIGDLKKNTWFLDQYKNPHESTHTMGEVIRWFEKNGFEFMNSIPKISFDSFSSNEHLFAHNNKGNIIIRMLIQLRLLFQGSKEGGFYIMIGKKVK
jgi:SAM-dependent methyltransferase/uncharacterized protein YbaR (Trm112 family)